MLQDKNVIILILQMGNWGKDKLSNQLTVLQLVAELRFEARQFDSRTYVLTSKLLETLLFYFQLPYW